MATMSVPISWGTIKSLLIVFSPIIIPKAFEYYRRFRASSQATKQRTQSSIPTSAVRSIWILAAASLILFVLALPFFAPENIFKATSSRIRIHTDVIFTRLENIRPDNRLTEVDDALRAKFVSIEGRLLYLQYGPDVLASCPFCSSKEPTTYLYYAMPSLLAPFLVNLVVVSLATSGAIAGPEATQWRSFGVVVTAALAIINLFVVASYRHNANAHTSRVDDIDMFFWKMRTIRYLLLGVLDAGLAGVVWLTATNRFFDSPLSPAARVEAVTRRLLATKSKLSGVGIVRNTNLRDEDLRARTATYWAHEGQVMREVMEEREVVEGVNDALANRINIQNISRDAENYALNMWPNTTPSNARPVR
ncbi:hypothetical protein F4678DRAFT_421479 [Xylaria arbuscula]|nr:hypothetical protein F4678DRAFT_421479 [Xylaria arbuscula]